MDYQCPYCQMSSAGQHELYCPNNLEKNASNSSPYVPTPLGLEGWTCKINYHLNFLNNKIQLYEFLMNEFCDRCENFEVRNRYIYEKFCKALGRENKLCGKIEV
jgi:hypothetical protein